MSARKNERTLKMMENFMSLHKEGYSILDIAKKFDLSDVTVYKNLDEIARNNGVSRESLLEKVFVADHSGRNFTPVQPIDRANFEKSYTLAKDALIKMKSEIENSINDIDTMNEILEEELK